MLNFYKNCLVLAFLTGTGTLYIPNDGLACSAAIIDLKSQTPEHRKEVGRSHIQSFKFKISKGSITSYVLTIGRTYGDDRYYRSGLITCTQCKQEHIETHVAELYGLPTRERERIKVQLNYSDPCMSGEGMGGSDDVTQWNWINK